MSNRYYYRYFWIGALLSGLCITAALMTFGEIVNGAATRDNISPTMASIIVWGMILWFILAAYFFPYSKYVYNSVVSSLFGSGSDGSTRTVVFFPSLEAYVMWWYVRALVWLFFAFMIPYFLWGIAPILGPMGKAYLSRHPQALTT
jgi:hypothetical protein